MEKLATEGAFEGQKTETDIRLLTNDYLLWLGIHKQMIICCY